jgi:beta-phosphoglucomutase family hydrolase
MDKGVIFDLDGVLIDSGWAHKQAWFELARKKGVEISEEFFHRTFGMQNYQIIPLLLRNEISKEQLEYLSEWKEQRYRELIAAKLTFVDGARELLEDLKSNDFALAVGSSAPDANLELVKSRLKLDDYFHAYVTSKDVKVGKPAPDTFLRAAEKLGLSANRCIVVEDAVTGVEAAKAAGMKVVAITTTRRREDLTKADMIIDSFSELRAEHFEKLLIS